MCISDRARGDTIKHLISECKLRYNEIIKFRISIFPFQILKEVHEWNIPIEPREHDRKYIFSVFLLKG